jgi:hypothetical protein
MKLFVTTLLLACSSPYIYGAPITADLSAVKPGPISVLSSDRSLSVTWSDAAKDRWETIFPLADGSVAVGVVNMSQAAAPASIEARDLAIRGKVTKARDLWTHQDVQFANGVYSATVPAHGVLLLRVWAR